MVKIYRFTSLIKQARWGLAGSGVMYFCPDDNTVLLLRRSQEVEDPDIWSIPGGAMKGTDADYDDDVESPEFSEDELRDSAYSEVQQEMGHLPKHDREEGSHTTTDNNFNYTTFLSVVSPQQKAWINQKLKLNWENEEAGWFDADRLPEDIHPGVISAIENLILSQGQLA